MNGVNLIPASHRDAKRRRVRARAWIGGCGAYALFLVVLCVAMRAASVAPPPARAGEADAATNRIQELNAAIAHENKSLAQVEASRAASRAVSDRPNWSALLAIIASKLDGDTVLSRCRIDPLVMPPTTKDASAKPAVAAKVGEKIVTPPRQFQLELGGMSRSQGAVSDLVLRLQETGLFEGVELVKTSREPFLAKEAIAFQIRCLLKERPRAKE